jgi:hypothetical protein
MVILALNKTHSAVLHKEHHDFVLRIKEKGRHRYNEERRGPNSQSHLVQLIIGMIQAT